jgi:hypothetical protein
MIDALGLAIQAASYVAKVRHRNAYDEALVGWSLFG